ncbi:metal ABC transporter permease [Candidatus Dojkabacteria bacterium]|nr:metal ABC transporter permease [Candidatus Dojkabacteria bacterium]
MEIFGYEFFQRAILILVLASIVSGIIGSLVVVKKISMASGSIAHGAFGGLGIAYYLNISPLLGALGFSLFGALIIGFVHKLSKKFLDSTLSMFWAGGMAVGLIFIFLTPGYAGDLFSYLFGNILLSRSSDLVLLLPLALITVLGYAFIKETLLATLFNEEFAKLKGVKVNVVFTLFMVLIAFTAVLLIKTMGVVLALAILTISPSTALRFAKNVDKMMMIAVILNLFTSIGGLFIAYYLNLLASPVIILVQIGVFGLSFLFSER